MFERPGKARWNGRREAGFEALLLTVCIRIMNTCIQTPPVMSLQILPNSSYIHFPTPFPSPPKPPESLSPSTNTIHQDAFVYT